MPAGLVALDLDGTLLTEDSRLSQGHRRAVADLRSLGLEVAIVTGRPLLTARWVHQALSLDTPLVCFNGGWVGYPEGRVLQSVQLCEAEVREVVAALLPEGGTISCYPQANEWIMDRETPQVAQWRSFYEVPIGIDPDRVGDWRGTSCKLMFVAEPERLGGVADRLRRHFPGRYHVVVSQPDRFEVSPAGITKAWGLAHLAAHLGVPRDRVWAVGDADNDREMLAWAGHGCAMGQAGERVRASARHVLPGVEARGLCALPGLIASHPG